jgi:hypothetical protein
MAESSEILFDSILKMENVTITEVHEIKYVVYFKANGHKFCCAAGKVYHERHPFYGSPMAEDAAAREKNPIVIIKEEKRSEEFNKNWDGWQENEDKIIEEAFNKMLPHILLNDTAKAKKVFESYFDCILPGKGANRMIKKLMNKDGREKSI